MKQRNFAASVPKADSTRGANMNRSSMKEGRHELIPPRIFWRHNRENQNLCKQQCWNAEEQRWKNQRYAACQTEVRRYADREN
jgi:hypothetical protein